MYRLAFNSILLLFISLSLHCAREVVIDLPEEPSKIVAVSSFTTDDVFQVRVTLTQPIYGEGEAQAPNNTTVTVAKDGELYARLTRQSEGAYWTSKKKVEPGVAYTLNVQLGGYPLTSATSSVPEQVDIEPISINPAQITIENLENGEQQQLRIPITLRLAAPLPAQPYFAFNITSDIDVGTEPDFTIAVQQAYFAADGRTLALLHNIPENVVLINEKYWSEGQRTLFLNALVPFKATQQQHPVRLYVEWRTLSEEFYRYHLSVARQGSNLPLSEPDAVFNNVLNGYGNFSGYATHTQVIELPK